MAQAIARQQCGVCGDSFQAREGDCCGRCQSWVCPACSHARGRHSVSVLCFRCSGTPAQTGIRGARAYRIWKRLRYGT
ncbi:MAG: hypothetical protein FJX77_08185 [Armatimonadetes bacterium]|nr:hypothetical protein [Armatimonadota bacterium]